MTFFCLSLLLKIKNLSKFRSDKYGLFENTVQNDEQCFSIGTSLKLCQRKVTCVLRYSLGTAVRPLLFWNSILIRSRPFSCSHRASKKALVLICKSFAFTTTRLYTANALAFCVFVISGGRSIILVYRGVIEHSHKNGRLPVQLIDNKFVQCGVALLWLIYTTVVYCVLNWKLFGPM